MFIICSVGIILLFLFLAIRYGVVSVVFILSLFLYLPSLAPFIARFVLKFDYFTGHNFFLQDNYYLITNATELLFVSMSIYVLGMIMFDLCGRKVKFNSYFYCRNIVWGAMSYTLFIILSLFFCYLIEPGETLLTVSYSELLQQRFDGTQFAGALHGIFWILAFQNYIKNDKFFILNKLFILTTFLEAIWLMLHARRSELVGLILIYILNLKYLKRLRRNHFVIFIFFIIALVLVERLRCVALFNMSFGEIVELLNPYYKNKSFLIFALPGGASNIYMTFLETLYLLKAGYYFFPGETYLYYFYNIIPYNLILALGLPKPKYFFDILSHNFSYLGGTYVFAPAYANFGIVGIFLISLFLAYIVNFVERNIVSHDYKKHGIALIVLFFFARGVWYEPITIIKPFLVLFFVYFVIIPSVSPLINCKDKLHNYLNSKV